jgi:hypothetical protein
VVGRFCASETELLLGATDGGANKRVLRVEPGTIVQVDTASLQLDPAVWGPNAGEFRPERWNSRFKLTKKSNRLYKQPFPIKNKTTEKNFLSTL